jgi:hypothetical protein
MIGTTEMTKKLKVVEPAVKEKSGKILKDTPAYSHEEIEKKAGRKKNADKRGFLLSNGKFADREEAAKVAKKAGEVKDAGKKLHSHELRKSLKIKKAPEPK